MQADLIPAGQTPLILRPHPFTVDTGVYCVRGGQSLQAMLLEASNGRDIGPTVRVEIGGYEVPRELWPRVKPKPGVPIHATVMPAGGNGGKILRTVLLVVISIMAPYVAVWLGASGFGAALITVGVMMVGTLAVNALIPPPKPGGLQAASGPAEAGRWNALTGSSNQANPYGPIPHVIGEAKIFPTHAALPYSEVLGDTSYHRYLFDLGYGDLDVTNIKIGDSDIASFTEVEYEITDTPTLYTSDVNETAISAALNVADEVVSVERTTDAGIDEVSLDIVFPQGLFGFNDLGLQIIAKANLTIEYRETGTSTWLTPTDGVRVTGAASVTLDSLTVTGHHKPFAVGVSFRVVKNASSYDVRVTRNATDWGTTVAGNRVGDAVWSVLRSITNTNPSTTGTTKLAMRIKATDQLSGTLQTVNCIVRQKIPVYDPETETWSANTANFNTAWVMHWLLKGAGGAFATTVPDSRIDLDNLVAFADFCTTNEFETRGVLDSPTTMRQLLDDVLACSLAALTMRDGRYGVLFDDGSTLPTMSFTPLDSRDFRVSRVFTRLPHALKVRFRNPEADWETDEVIVLDDGYSLNGLDARGNPSSDPEPTEFESIDLRMSCDAFSAWKVGRFHFAQARFRGVNYEWGTDIANLAMTRGDCVHVAHDVTEWGTGWGRVRALTDNGDGTATLVLDETIETVTGTSYSVELRKNDGSSVIVAATPHSPQTETFYLASAPAGVNVGDAAVLGETGSETAKLLVTGIRPGADLSAALTAVAYSAEVAAYWANPPAAIESQVSGHSYRDAPLAPNITIIVSDLVNETPDDAGVPQPEVHVYVPPTSGYLDVPPWRNLKAAA